MAASDPQDSTPQGAGAKPALILHIGAPKTGTTALQSRLAASALALAARGVLYPQAQGATAHAFLIRALDFTGRAPRLTPARDRRDPARVQRRFRRDWDALRAEIARSRPARVVLSSEFLFSRMEAGLAAPFRALLEEVFSGVTVVAYVRQPSRGHLSVVGQHVRYADTLPPTAPRPFRAHLEQWEAAFPGCLRVRGYDRDLLEGRDIVQDFLVHALDLSPDAVTLAPAARSNEGLSAEAAAVMQQFRAALCPGRKGRHPVSGRLFAALRRADAADPAPGPSRLRPGLAEWLDLGCTDLLWLRDRHGVVFPALDYGAIAPRDPPPGPFRTVADVAEVDAARMARLRCAALARAPLARAWLALRRVYNSLRT